ncbi:MAG: hypothetical protein WC839_01220 [Candidatus Paceibacterota bacterium]
MTFKKFYIIIFLVFSILPTQKIFAQTPNTGFVSENIWYSKDPLMEGDKVQIYTFVFNPDSRELSGTVIFFDKTVLLGKKEFVIPPKGAKDVFINWTTTAGDHIIFAKIENAKFLLSNGKYEEVYIALNETEKNSQTISKKITSADTNTDINPISNISNTVSDSISNIKNIIEEKTPNFITQPILATTNKLEELRKNINTTGQLKKEEIKKEIENLNSTKINKEGNSKTTRNPLLKPFKYVELFFVSTLSLILNNKILFYGILLILIFFILRYIWKKIF